jgi:hypothetical protein
MKAPEAIRCFLLPKIVMDKLLKKANSAPNDLTFEIGSNSDLVLENTITGNLEWTIKKFAHPVTKVSEEHILKIVFCT